MFSCFGMARMISPLHTLTIMKNMKQMRHVLAKINHGKLCKEKNALHLMMPNL